MNKFLSKAQLYSWGACQALFHGRPEISLGYLGGIGDDLLCTAPIEEWLNRGVHRIWFITRYPSLYSHYDRRVRLIPEDARLQQLATRLHRPMRPLNYSTYDPATDCDSPVAEHLIAVMCRRAGLSGRISLRPYLKLRQAELTAMSAWAGYIAVQVSSMSAALPMQNKQWPSDRLQTVVDQFAGRFHFVQIGSTEDPTLRGVADLRGRTTLRETAAVLAQSRIFVGIVGFLMHLARAVDCPAVIVYGGREPPELTGYDCNINVACRPPCAPCWQRNRCAVANECMTGIGPDQVIAAINSALGRPRGPLTVNETTL